MARSERRLAIGVDARTRGFDAAAVLEALQRLRANPALRAELVFVWADEATLLRRYTATRRRHPMAPQGRVGNGISAEEALTARLREGADLVIDTSGLPLPALRQQIERQFGVRRRVRQRAAGGVAGFLRLRARPAAGSRSGIRCTLFAESAL